MHAVGEENADVLEPRPSRRERIFEHPLPKGLRDHRPPVVDSEGVVQPGAIGVGRLRRDAVDHRVREGARRLEVANELVAASLGRARDRVPRDLAVARQVVAAEDRQPRAAVCTASVEAGDDGLDRRIRLVQRVAALGDRQGEDRDIGVRDLPRECVDVACNEPVVDDAADDSGIGAVAVALDQRVQVILRRKHVRDAPVDVEEPDPADPPVAAASGELVDVARQVGAVEPADAEMQDSRNERCAVVVRNGYAATFDCVEFRRREAERHVDERTRGTARRRSRSQCPAAAGGPTG